MAKFQALVLKLHITLATVTKLLRATNLFQILFRSNKNCLIQRFVQPETAVLNFQGGAMLN